MISKIGALVINNLQKSSIQKSFSTITVPVQKFKTHRLDPEILPQTVTATKQELTKLYYDMQVMRRMEIECDRLYKLRHIRGFLHLYDGQEGVITGIEAALNREDCLITAYRDHCHAYTRGNTVHQIIAEMMGKRTGSTKGKGGSMHYYNKKTNFYGGHGIVGAQLPMGTGLAFALKYSGKPNVAVAMYGDGGSNQGQFFEASNMAYLWKLPVIYICENNLYSMGTPLALHAMNTNLYERGDQIPGLLVDAQNYFNVKAIMQWAKDYSVQNGPLYIEMQTYRYHGHSMSDPGVTYRTADEIQQVRESRDPILNLENAILENKFATIQELKQMANDAKKEVAQASERAINDAFPDASDLTKDIYVDNNKHFMRGIEYKDSFFPNGKPY